MSSSRVTGPFAAAMVVLVAMALPATAYDLDVAARAFAANTLEKPVAVATLRGWAGDDSAIEERRFERIVDANAWDDVWRSHAPGVAAPVLDFRKEMAVAIFAGKPPLGKAAERFPIYSIRAEDVIEVMTMSFPESPGVAGLSVDKVTPYVIAVLPRSLKPVVIVARTMGASRSPQVQYQVVKEFPAVTSASYRRAAKDRLARGDVDRAIAELDLAVELDPSSAPAYEARGLAWQAKGDFDRAIADFDQSIKLNPNDAALYNNRCWMIAIAGRDLAKALADCDRALRLKPFEADALDSRGFVNLQLGRLDAAIADYGAALGRDPKLASSLYGRGVARQRKGEATQGAADIVAAKLIKPDIAEQYARYGVKAE
jgi:Tfp pilus assembly protein PilF